MNFHILYLMIILGLLFIFLYKYKKATSEYLEELEILRRRATSMDEDLSELRIAHTTLVDQRMAQLQRILDLHAHADIVEQRVNDNGYATTADVEQLMRIIQAIKGIKLELL